MTPRVRKSPMKQPTRSPTTDRNIQQLEEPWMTPRVQKSPMKQPTSSPTIHRNIPPLTMPLPQVLILLVGIHQVGLRAVWPHHVQRVHSLPMHALQMQSSCTKEQG